MGTENGSDSTINRHCGFGTHDFRKQMSLLSKTLFSIDFIHSKSSKEFMRGLADTSDIQAMFRDGKEYLVYLGIPGISNIELLIPEGNYSVVITDLSLSKIFPAKKIKVSGPSHILAMPAYSEDLSVLIRKQ